MAGTEIATGELMPQENQLLDDQWWEETMNKFHNILLDTMWGDSLFPAAYLAKHPQCQSCGVPKHNRPAACERCHFRKQ